MHRRGEHRAGFRLLYVCTGNICRSPFAEILTRHLLIGRLGGRAAAAFEVSSAGVQAVVGSSVHPDTRRELVPWGLDRTAAPRFAARQLRSAMIEGADLVLGAGPRHRAASVEKVPAALGTAFSLREFARLACCVDVSLLPADPVARAHSVVEHAWRHRGMGPARRPEDDQVPDPMGGPESAHHLAAVLIADAVQTIVDVIAPPLRPRSRTGDADPPSASFTRS